MHSFILKVFYWLGRVTASLRRDCDKVALKHLFVWFSTHNLLMPTRMYLGHGLTGVKTENIFKRK